MLLPEIPAFFPLSWDRPQKLPAGKLEVNDVKNLISLEDGHLPTAPGKQQSGDVERH